MDIKTLNIVLDTKYNARLIDFGLAREMSQSDETHMKTDNPVMGTKGYLPTVNFKYMSVGHDYHNFGVGELYTLFQYTITLFTNALCIFVAMSSE